MLPSGDSVSPEVRIRNAEAAIERYGHPARSLRIIGVTGTNGKTTTVNILRSLLDDPSARSASIGTLGVLLGHAGETIPGGLGLTTPGPDELQRVLRELVDLGIRTVVMEVSSHALVQHRIHGVTLSAAVFTNLTRDHLDYHKTPEAYFAAKAQLVGYLNPDGVAIINADDPVWAKLPHAPRRVTFGVQAGEVRADDVSYTSQGSAWTLRYGGAAARVRLPLIGDFNVSNAVGAAAAVLATQADALPGMPDGITLEQGIASARAVSDVAARLSRIPQVPGRLEMIADRPTVLRDYAHTPDALERALGAIRPFAQGRVIVVFGAGGDRDAGKRPLMGAIAERDADVAIVTSDNPRTESPGMIIDDIERGMTRGRHERIEDRHVAIARALEIAAPDDVVLLAGKGHETYQVIGTDKHPFDEQQIVQEFMAAR
ncbi:MAG TPA: UDP-N-acetylmuramoyl-L-alanyl-D-glutamate--2,6-diaminopimelate ligase [Gemmatimonadaceae bacterium]|nr:UDP-N-acetylmuramoyl-L-alanyl-D-glutamate--2,6-diaminopimelate ligase [Gemmatimonadaceae bacterium]